MAEANHEFAAETEPEEPPSRLARLGQFLYNKEDGSFLGRNCTSWLKITAFYIVYYSCLAGFFMGMMSVFLYGIISNEMPHRTGQNSLLEMNPGLGFRPHADMDDTLIEFTMGSRATYARHVANLQEMYDMYQALMKKPEEVGVRQDCGPNAEPDNEPSKVCKFDWDKELSGCTPGNDFGYDEGKPCVVLKMNRVYGWLPDIVDTSVNQSLVECEGENPADRENIGEIEYLPSVEANITGTPRRYGFFNQAYYPYLRQPWYRAPLVALRFKSLRINNVVMVECRMRNLKNTKFNSVDRDGMVRFELFMKD